CTTAASCIVQIPTSRVSAHNHLADFYPFPTRRSSDLVATSSATPSGLRSGITCTAVPMHMRRVREAMAPATTSGEQRIERAGRRSEEHTSELQSLRHIVCRLLLEKKRVRAANALSDW